ncbi:Low molecular weight protein-tyrosine-phosphatase wzb [Oceanococcus atlanticus]|uniref:protein-tyrosine-phosphatase n=1 Tax=Oceanococcus atlanticus TaxID=1317117 RepID=A0A1Y1SE42_9GAMM|nr:low molecular weight protein-tyrosine-phosphatase [Oceanococcus atlanticus]ORE87260.1 Low molecular weight protein-tyrosine-phosphatase wzb [Oceanococcus atlanticus]RZO87016.1 MAG: low molecular weight phosphotyrosine protein phosphatase [Oceanococcus sp.]
MFSSLLVVCTGNICRSPMGEFLLRDRWRKSGARVASAGVGAMLGWPADDDAIAVMDDYGIDMRAHQAQQIKPELLKAYDLVLVMEKHHEDWINQRFPTTRGRVHLMSKWQARDGVPDPYRRGRAAFEACYAQLDECVDQWLQRIG